MKTLFSLILLVAISLADGMGQQPARRMVVDTLYESAKGNAEASSAYLHVRSQAPSLRFESDRIIFKTNELPSGEWELWLPPGVHMLTIDAPGFQRLELPPFDFARKRSYELLLKARDDASPAAYAEEELIDVTFILNEDSVFTSYGGLPPVMSDGRRVLYRLPHGSYAFTFQKDGFAPQVSRVELDEPEEIAVALAAGPAEGSARLPLPGGVRIISEPPGAAIIINGRAFGATPFEGELAAGTHRLELRRRLYYPDVSTLSVEEGTTVTFARKLKPKFGYLTVTSPSPGGMLYLDGKEIGPLPVTERFIESGKHIVRVEVPEYLDHTEEIEVLDGEEKILTPLLTPAYGTLEVTSQPEPGADVYLNGTLVGNTPCTLEKLAPGKYLLKVTKPLYADVEEEVVVGDADTVRKQIVLGKEFGEIIVSAPESDIFIDGERKGRETYSARLSPGTYTLRATREGPYTMEEKELSIGAGEQQSIALEPKGRYATLSVEVEPAEAGDAEIYLGEHVQGNAPLDMKVLMGEYRVTAKKPGFLEQTDSVAVLENELRTLRFTLARNEGSRQASIEKWGKVKWASGIGALVAGGAAIYFKAQSNRYYDNYIAARTTNDAVAFRDKTQSNDRLFVIALSAAGGLAATAIVSWIVQAAD